MLRFRAAWRSLSFSAISSTNPTLRNSLNALACSLEFSRRHLCSASADFVAPSSERHAAPAQIERVPLPPGLSNDKFGLYEVLESSQDLGDVSGKNAVVAIHGPTELWLPKGIEAHGASGGMWAVIATSGTQYKVMKGDVLYTNRQVAEVNTQIAFDSVLAIGAFDWTLFGRPAIRHAKVLATVEEQTKSAKIMITKFKKRKGYSRKQGHRQLITRFRIDDIVYEWPDAHMIKPYEVPFHPKRPPLPNHMRPL